VGELVRRGQEEGTIRRQGQSFGNGAHTPDEVDELPKPVTAYFGRGNQEQTDAYALADADPEQFDAAIEEAKAEYEAPLAKERMRAGTEKSHAARLGKEILPTQTGAPTPSGSHPQVADVAAAAVGVSRPTLTHPTP